jgi:hypothetical protein
VPPVRGFLNTGNQTLKSGAHLKNNDYARIEKKNQN